MTPWSKLRGLPSYDREREEPSIPRMLHSQQVATAIRMGKCPDDRQFDRFLPFALRVVSSQYWTPLAVALRVADWLEQFELEHVVDIGSGAGKFCVAAALAGSARFVGLEQREKLVGAARELAKLFGVEDRVSFVVGALGAAELPEADAYYLYNPFGENLFGPEDQLDNDVELSCDRYVSDVHKIEALLASARIGTCVVAYNGFGGELPEQYELVRVDYELPCVLRMWRKQPLHAGLQTPKKRGLRQAV